MVCVFHFSACWSRCHLDMPLSAWTQPTYPRSYNRSSHRPCSIPAEQDPGRLPCSAHAEHGSIAWKVHQWTGNTDVILDWQRRMVRLSHQGLISYFYFMETRRTWPIACPTFHVTDGPTSLDKWSLIETPPGGPVLQELQDYRTQTSLGLYSPNLMDIRLLYSIYIIHNIYNIIANIYYRQYTLYRTHVHRVSVKDLQYLYSR